jgi:predicted  nucleic acid-binding Zn-ribbon protein
LIALQDELDRTKRELELVSTPAARAQARKSSASTERDDDGTPRKDLKKELSQASKQVDEWRKKAQSAQEEVKKMSRVLAKELGDGVTIGG